MFRRWGHDFPCLERADFMTQEEAAEALGRSTTLGIGLLIGRQILRPAFLVDGTEGITRESVEAELEWRRSASSMRKLRRALGGLLHWIF